MHPRVLPCGPRDLPLGHPGPPCGPWDLLGPQVLVAALGPPLPPLGPSLAAPGTSPLQPALRSWLWPRTSQPPGPPLPHARSPAAGTGSSLWQAGFFLQLWLRAQHLQCTGSGAHRLRVGALGLSCTWPPGALDSPDQESNLNPLRCRRILTHRTSREVSPSTEFFRPTYRQPCRCMAFKITREPQN